MKETFPVLPYGFPAAVVGVIVFAIASTRSEALAWALLLGGIALWFGVKRWLRARQASVGIDGVAGGPRNWVELVDRSDDPLAVAQASATGLGNFVGLDEAGNAAFSEPEQSTLVIGPPRSGKTSGLVVPMLLTHNGPAVVTSTKDEVARITSMARYRRGRVLLFDLSGEAGMQLPAQMEPLRWSPLQSASRGWLDAVKMARAMTEASVRRSGVEDASYWTQRAAQLLAALLYAASRPQPTTGKPADMGDVVGWVATSDLEAAADALIAAGRHDDDARRAARQLESIQAAPDKERGSIVSTCYSTIEAYNSAGALRMSTDPTFDPAAFVASHGDTIYVTATSEDQAALAPLVVGLLQDVRRATFARARIRDLHAAGPRSFVLFLLDEVANIAPIPDLPQLVSEAGGQGLRIAAILQNLPQAAERWGKEASYGMLSTFGQVVVFGGTRDPETLGTLSTLLGTEVRYTPSVGYSSGGAGPASTTTAWSQQMFPVATPAEISQIPAGWLLVFDGGGHRFLLLSQYYRYQPWPRMLQLVYAAGWTKQPARHDYDQVLSHDANR